MTKAVRSWGFDGGSVSMMIAVTRYAVTAARRLVCAVIGSLICAVSNTRDRKLCRVIWPNTA